MTDDPHTEGGSARLWYTRRDGEVRGPFPLSVIHNHILLGRLHANDELSADGETWRPLSTLPELIPDVMKHVQTREDEEALRLARLRADERRSPERRSAEAAVSTEQRRHDRRRPETVEDIQHRVLAEDLNAARRRVAMPHRTVLPTLVVLLVALGVVGMFFWLSPSSTDEPAVDCAAPAAPAVNWSYCHKEGASLAQAALDGANLSNARLLGANLTQARLVQADLRYANLSGARLEGARLAGANLTGAILAQGRLDGANLEGADLSFANLQGASLVGSELSGVRLHKTIWIDGRVCAAESVGTCR